MLHHDTKPLFHIYPYLDAGEYRNTLLGSVVKYPDIPTEGYAPHKAGKQPRHLVPGLDPTPIQVTNTKFLTHRIRDSDISSSLDDYLDGLFESSDALVRTAARLWHMESSAEKLQKLLQQKTYSKRLMKLLQSSHSQEGYFITDIVTVFDAAVDTYKSPRTIGQGHSQTEQRGPIYYEGEMIAFLGYRLVRLEKSDGIMGKLARVFLGQGHGLTVRDESDYWPQATGTPATGGGANAGEGFVPSPAASTKMVRELGFDFEVVG